MSPSIPGPSDLSVNKVATTPTQVQQRLEPAPPAPAETAMDVEETVAEKQCNTGYDADSGIDVMEVDNSDRKNAASRSRVIFFNFLTYNL